MPKIVSATLFLLLPITASLSYAQSSGASTKIYSGYLHTMVPSKHRSFLGKLFGEKPPQEEVVDDQHECFLEFKCPIALTHQPPMVVPESLTYFIKFTKDVLGKFVIKIYTNDDEDYTIDPGQEGRQAGPDGPHHIYDTYLIYLVLGQDINHLEVVGTSGHAQQRYVLDKLTIKDDQ